MQSLDTPVNWSDVTKAASRPSIDLDLTQPQTKAAYQFWLDKRAGRLMPSPKDINPAEIRSLLHFISILEVVPGPPVDYLYRIDGEAVRSAIGFTRTGRRHSEFADRIGPAHSYNMDCFAAIRADAKPRCARLALSHLSRSFYVLEIVYLPFSEDGTTVHRIMQCVSFIRKPKD